MKCLRKAVNKTRRDKVRNTRIREELNIKPTLQKIEIKTQSGYCVDKEFEQIINSEFLLPSRAGLLTDEEPLAAWSLAGHPLGSVLVDLRYLFSSLSASLCPQD